MPSFQETPWVSKACASGFFHVFVDYNITTESSVLCTECLKYPQTNFDTEGVTGACSNMLTFSTNTFN